MNTSLQIDDRLYEAAAKKADHDHTTVDALIEAGLHRVLEGELSADADSQRDYESRLCEGLCALPDLDFSGADLTGIVAL